ncbi:MAG: adenylate kinase [Chloroflexi bacterium]|nr:adenylate kinase [Chloroflexota bacterium]
MYIVLLGAPGAGKGTQAELLREKLAIPSVSSGDLFRSAIEAGTELGVKAKEYIDRGELVPDGVTIAMVAERLAQPDCTEGVILDGFPRTVAQAEALDGVLAEMNRRVHAVLYIKVSEDVLLKRLAGRWTCRDCGAIYHEVFGPEKTRGVCDACGGALYQREDDTPETQQRRIAVYLDRTAPLQECYRAKGILIEIDGDQDVDVVHRSVMAAIDSLEGNDTL